MTMQMSLPLTHLHHQEPGTNLWGCHHPKRIKETLGTHSQTEEDTNHTLQNSAQIKLYTLPQQPKQGVYALQLHQTIWLSMQGPLLMGEADIVNNL